MNNETKKQMIYESFDVLKDSWEEKDTALRKLLCRMYKIDSNVACEMWLYLLKHNKSILNNIDESYNASALVGDIIYDITEYDTDKEKALANLIFKNKELYSIIYGECCSIDSYASSMLSYVIASDDTSKLYDILSLLKGNKTNESIGSILTTALENCVDNSLTIPKCQIELLENFVSKIPDKAERAEAFAALLSIEEE
jgi:hypothetical protein